MQLKKTSDKERKAFRGLSEDRKLHLPAEPANVGTRSQRACPHGSLRPGGAQQGWRGREGTDTFGKIVSKYQIPALLFLFGSSHLRATRSSFVLLPILSSPMLHPQALFSTFPLKEPLTAECTPRGPSGLLTAKVKLLHDLFKTYCVFLILFHIYLNIFKKL